MADENTLQDLDTQVEEENRIEKRIKDLSGKVKQTSEERDAAKAQANLAETEKQAALKDAEFYKNFNTTASKYSGAVEFQDKIKELHAKGYDMEDAMVAVLNKEGKFTPTAPPVPKASPAGGSATTTLKGSDKAISDMTQAERRAELIEAEKRGEIGLT